MMNSRCTSRPSLSMGLAGSITAVGNGWRGGMNFTIAGLSGFGVSATVGGVVVGLRMYVFMNMIVYGLNCVRSVAPSGVAFNPSWHLTCNLCVNLSVKVPGPWSRYNNGWQRR